jgi:hypothetical protein
MDDIIFTSFLIVCLLAANDMLEYHAMAYPLAEYIHDTSLATYNYINAFLESQSSGFISSMQKAEAEKGWVRMCVSKPRSWFPGIWGGRGSRKTRNIEISLFFCSSPRS